MPHLVRKIGEGNPKEITCGILKELTTGKDFSGMDFAHVTITGETKKHFHKKLTEVYFVLKGRIKVEVDGEVKELGKGEMIMIFPNTEHKAWKIGEDAELLVVCCPPWAEEDEILVED